MLCFAGDIRSAVDREGFHLSGFSQLVFDYEEYGSMRPHARVYDSGEVVFCDYPIVRA